MSIILQKSICTPSYRTFSTVYHHLALRSTLHLIRICHFKSQPAAVRRIPSACNRNVHTSAVRHTFWERDKKGGYDKLPMERVTQKKLILDGLKELKQEILLWKEEVKEQLISDPIVVFRPGEIDVMWQFTTAIDLDQWIVTSDSDHAEGQSVCTLDLSSSGYGMFSGTVESQVPLDGRIKRSGYCNINTVRARVRVQNCHCRQFSV